MKYSFHPKELNNLKAWITERLVEYYFEQNLVPRLKKEGWDFVIFVSCPWFSVPKSLNFNPDFNNEKVFFLSNSLLPTPKLLRNFKKLTETLENMPDGFLVKLKNTRKSKSLKTGIAEMGVRFETYSFGVPPAWGFGIDNTRRLKECGHAVVKQLSFDTTKHDTNELLPVVDGEIEVIEVKSGKSNLQPHQKISYDKIIREGYVLRFFHVNMVSFEKNKFEIEEKLIVSPTELKSFPLKEKDRTQTTTMLQLGNRTGSKSEL